MDNKIKNRLLITGSVILIFGLSYWIYQRNKEEKLPSGEVKKNRKITFSRA